MKHPTFGGRPILIGDKVTYKAGSEGDCDGIVAGVRMAGLEPHIPKAPVIVLESGREIVPGKIIRHEPEPLPPPVHYWVDWKGGGEVFCDEIDWLDEDQSESPSGIRCVTRDASLVSCGECWECLK